MAVTMQQVRRVLDPEEPDYVEAAELGPEALPHLEKLVRQNDAMLSSKAAYLAALIPHGRAANVVKLAAESGDAVVRIAAAAAARLLPGSDASAVLEPLLGDSDAGVRKVALNAVETGAGASIVQIVERMARGDSSSGVQNAAAQALARLGGEGRYPSAKAASGAEGHGMGGGSMDGAKQMTAGSHDASSEGQGGGSIAGSPARLGGMPIADIVEDSGGAGSGGGSLHPQTGDLDDLSGAGQGGGSVRG
jgi:hypothetical protein